MADLESIPLEASTLALETHEPPAAATPGSDAGSNPPHDAKEDDDQDTVSVKTTTESLFSVDLAEGPPEERNIGLGINSRGWSGSNYDDYDIITVHGIRDDYKTAWTDKNGDWWVKKQLFKKLSVREIDYSYDIDEESILYQPNGIRLHAERLVEEYAEIRRRLEETETDRPIIWICHDLGGTIVKEALSIATNNPLKYGKISILTTALIFLGTPHRFQSMSDLEDQLHKLILLPGPEIRNRVLPKVRNLAVQVNKTNQSFLATKLFDRAVIFNIFTQSVVDSLSQKHIDETIGADGTDLEKKESLENAVTPFPRYAHFVGHSFEAAGRLRLTNVDHLNHTRGDADDEWFSFVSDMVNESGCIIKVYYRAIHLQARLLSLAPPTRALNVPFDPVLPKHPIISWIQTQKPYITFEKTGNGPRLLHLHGNGNSLVDISEVSRLFYADYDSLATGRESERKPDNTVIYFEFDQWDSRYNDLSSMLTYLINVISWHFWTALGSSIPEELGFMNDTGAYSLEGLYNMYSVFRYCTENLYPLIIFIGCFDQCPEDQRRWFLERILKEQSYSEATHRIVLSTSTRDGLAVPSFPDETRINLDDCPAISESGGRLAEELQLGLAGLIANRPIYDDFRQQLERLLEECSDAPFLGHIILNWLGQHHRGIPKSKVADKIDKLFPPTAKNIVQVFISSLAPELQARASNVFNWVKHASEPWSPDSLIEALAVHEFPDEELSLDDADKDCIMTEIKEAFGGIITVENRDVKFSHPSFYILPEAGMEGSAEERAAKVNSILAETCLRYFQLKGAQEALAEFCLKNFEGGPWKTSLEAVVISHPRVTLAEYAVRFWPKHYKASGQFKPSKLVHELFASKQARASWEVPFWLLSNPVTRIQRHYISTLPTFAMLGLEDLLSDKVETENGQRWFEKDRWLAITEAARAGNKEIVKKLLEHARVDEEELQNALFWVAAQGNIEVLNMLLEKIPDLETFQWPSKIIYRAAAAGQEDLLAALLLSGADINETGSYWGASSVMVAAWLNQVSAIKFLVNSEYKLDINLKDNDGDSSITYATTRGEPQLIELLLQAGADIETRYDDGRGLVQLATQECRHKAIDILIKAGADFNTGKQHDNPPYYSRPPIIVAAQEGSRECVRLLLHHKADLNTECSTGSALYKAVLDNRVDVTRMLLEHDPKPDMEVTPEDEDMLLFSAVRTGNTELVSLLIEHGAKVDFVDPNGSLCKTPLSKACYRGDLEMVKLLLDKKADINYTGGSSDPPLFTALYENEIEVARHLLQHEDVDVKWAGSDGMGSLHGAFNHAEIIPELLKRGAPIDGNSIFGTPLHMASSGNKPESIEVLLGNDPKPDLESVVGDNGSVDQEIGCTPLQLACMYFAPKCVKLLLEAGADTKFKNKNDEDAVDILVRKGTDSKDAEECLRLLLSEPYSVPVDQVEEEGQTRLHKIHHTTAVPTVRLLVEAKAPLEVVNQEGYTPLAIAVNKGNESVAKYLIEQGANVNLFGSNFGSILHIAVSNGYLDLAKMLVDSGADLETVNPEYGQSLLYTALGIENSSKLKRMVRYLVDDVKVPINKLGGQFGYPIIRAASNLAQEDSFTGNNMLRFLIRRKAQLNVEDSQGRRAVHLACTSLDDGGIRALVAAGAEINATDKFGRMPIHFAASVSHDECFRYLLDKFPEIDVNLVDHDNWTPLMWAARSGDVDTVVGLLGLNADVWVRSRASGARDEWSALKLANFGGRPDWLKERLEPKEHTRVHSGKEEKWDEFFHKIKSGHRKESWCGGCLVTIIGIQWKCLQCTHEFSLCFKCYRYRDDMHDPEHSFEEIEPLYDEEVQPLAHSTSSDNGGDELPHEASGDDSDEETANPPRVVESDDAVSSHSDGHNDGAEFDLDSFDLDTED
ncbi:hypothetical protein G7Z17_g2957 [Cylindrodendrum hubeiense]|uniref:C2H2-type domain-containing protein n=1 Tax=Cylindrodendrum hubeiense TaxID=595255 RepID=A0A9P5LJT8_9HYPO|nr:hypothetical protein G7Z17_g2957 [Cylindrodendrum hubeiense]